MTFYIQKIENRDYSAAETISIINNYYPCTLKSILFGSGSDSAIELPAAAGSNQYSGIEITNFINACGKLDSYSANYAEEKTNLATKLFNNEYHTQDVLTRDIADELGFFTWKPAVLEATKEDVAKHFEELTQKNAAPVQNEEQAPTPSESEEKQDQEENAQPKQEEISTTSDLESQKQEIEDEEYNEYGYSMMDYALVDDLDTNSDI